MILNFNWRPAGLGVVLVFGLVSCTPQNNPHHDSFRLSEPSILRRNQAREPLKAALAATVPVFQVEDEIAFGPEAAAEGVTISVRAACGTERHGTTYSRSAVFRSPRRLSMGNLVPLGSLSGASSDRRSISCRFDFIARNSMGSNHRFHFPVVRIEGLDRGGGVAIVDTRTSEAAKFEDLRHITSQFQARFDRAIDEVALDCETFTVRHGPTFAQQMNFDHFRLDWATPTDKQSILDLPRPHCRIVGLKNQEPVTTSGVFRFHLNKIEPLVEVSTPDLGPRGPEPIEVGQIRVANPHRYSFRLRIDLANLPWVDVTVVHPALPQVASRLHERLRLEPVGGTSSARATEDGRFFSAQIEPGRDLILRAYLPSFPRCNFQLPTNSIAPTISQSDRLGLWLALNRELAAEVFQGPEGNAAQPNKVADLMLIGVQPRWLAELQFGGARPERPSQPIFRWQNQACQLVPTGGRSRRTR